MPGCAQGAGFAGHAIAGTGATHIATGIARFEEGHLEGRPSPAQAKDRRGIAGQAAPRARAVQSDVS